MSIFQRKINIGALLLLFALVMSLDFVATSSGMEKRSLVHIVDSHSTIGAKRDGSKTVSFLGPTTSYGTECLYAEKLCSLLIAQPTARPTVWLQRFSYFGEYWVVKAEISGSEVISHAEQATLFKQARSRKLKTLLFVYAVTVLCFMFPFLTKRRGV